MTKYLTSSEAFERLIGERGWYKRASIPSTTAYKDRQKFIAKKLKLDRIETYLFAAGWLKTESGMYYLPTTVTSDIMGNDPQALTQLIQPNSITNSRSNMNLIQYKILSSIFLQLNPLIKKNIENKIKRVSEELFVVDNASSDKVEIEIAYRSFGMATNRYAEIRQALKSLASTTIEFENEEYEIITSLCSVYIPKAHKKSIKLEFKKEVANKLISIQTGYTKYSHEIIYRLNSINSIQFYLMCCSWRDKGGFKHDLNWIKRWLSMENKYSKLSDFERWVLKPAQAELRDKADVWFEYSIDKSNSSSVPMINFKVLKNLTDAEVQMYNDRYNKILHIWRNNFNFKTKTITDLSSLITIRNIKELYSKNFLIHQYIVENKIENIENYAYTALTNFFNNEEKFLE